MDSSHPDSPQDVSQFLAAQCHGAVYSFSFLQTDSKPGNRPKLKTIPHNVHSGLFVSPNACVHHKLQSGKLISVGNKTTK